MKPIKSIEISKLKPYKNNPRSISKEAINTVITSIKSFGFNVPILIDKNYEIIAGHTRYEASKILKLKTIPAIIIEDLNEQQVKAFRIMDNKSAEYSIWDYQKLQVEFKELLDYDFNLDLTGFTPEQREIISFEEEVEELPNIKMTGVIKKETDYVIINFENEMEMKEFKNTFNIPLKNKALSFKAFKNYISKTPLTSKEDEE